MSKGDRGRSDGRPILGMTTLFLKFVAIFIRLLRTNIQASDDLTLQSIIFNQHLTDRTGWGITRCF